MRIAALVGIINAVRLIGGARMLAIAAAAAVTACTGSVTDPTPPPGASASPPTASARPPAAVWNALDVGAPTYDGAFGGPFAGVTSGVAYGDGFVLVGRTIDEAETWHGEIWTSPDGGSWARVPDPGGSRDDTYIPIVGTDGSRLVALGWAVPWQDGRGPYVAWVSDDSATWERHDVESTALGGIDVSGIVGSPAGAGFLAWGPKPDGRSGLLRSADGLDWQAVDYPGSDENDISSVAAYWGGFLAVGGGHWDGQIGGPSEAAAAWWSPDGRAWHSANVAPGWVLRGVYPGAAGLYAIGSHECSRCVGPDLAWHSVDGRSWRLLGNGPEHQGFAGSNGAEIAAYAWQDDRSISISEDGVSWRKLVAGLPRAEYDAGMIVGATGILVLVAKTPVVDGVQRIHAGVMFLRGS